MTSRFAAALAVCTLAATPSLPSRAAAAQQPEYETTRIADGVYMFRYQVHNSMFVLTDEGVVVFDPINPEAARIYREEIRQITSDPIRAIVYSHHHGDHVSGAAALATNVPIISQALAREQLAAEPNPDIALPNRTFTDEMTLYMGSKTIHLVYLGPNHSNNSVVAHLPDQGIVFAVDFVSNDRVGYRDLPGYYFPALWESLERLQELDYQTAVFGHGAPGTKADVYDQINYWTDLRGAVEAALAAGMSEEEAVEAIDLPAYSDWGGYDNWFKMNLRTVYRYYAETG
ncbi:MAG: MBL fold metallo-hydrolase [Gemmatimonadota bacterium]|nr:MBL fold metallo-hydrolase [Candidatus Palauibacterales bacterium]